MLRAVGGLANEDVERVVGGQQHRPVEPDAPVGWARLGARGAKAGLELAPHQLAGRLRLRALIHHHRVVGHRHFVPGVMGGCAVGLRAGVHHQDAAARVRNEAQLVVVPMPAAMRTKLQNQRVVIGGGAHGRARHCGRFCC